MKKESYNNKNKCRFLTGVNSFWVVQSNKPVLQTINKLNSRKAAKSINTFDLSTLYTKLPHDKLQTMFHKFKDFCFDERENNFILLNYF